MNLASPMDQNTSSFGEGSRYPAKGPRTNPRESTLPRRRWDDDGLQVVPSEYASDRNVGPQVAVRQEKEAILGVSQAKEATVNQALQPGIQTYRYDTSSDKVGKKKRITAWKWMLGITVVVLIVVIAAVVAVVETRKRKESTDSSPLSPANSTNDGSPSSLGNISEASTTGAYKGTGLAVMAPPFKTVDLAWLIYQHHTGELMLAKYSITSAWQSPEKVGVSDALNGTAIAATAYQTSNLTVSHVFYVDTSGTLQDCYLTNVTNTWNRGNLGGLNHNASTVPGGALAAYFSLDYYGITRNVSGGIRLYANDGSNGNVLVELSYDYASSTWARGMQFDNSNGHAGASTIPYYELTTMNLITRQNKLEQWWWLSSTTSTKNDFPTGNWIKGQEASATILQNSSIGGCAFGNDSIWYQDPTGNITGIDHIDMKENERWGTPYAVNGGTNALLPAQIVCGAYPPPTNLTAPQEAHLFFQTNGTNIMDYRIHSDGWSVDPVSVVYSG